MGAQTPDGPGAFMSDRDNRRVRDPLHPGSGKGRLEPARTASGQCDSDDESWRDDVTPPARPIPHVVVDASAFDVDVRWAEFNEMRDSIARFEEFRLATVKKEQAALKRRGWIFGGGGITSATVIGFLIWAVTKLDARADARAEERLRIQMLNRHEAEIERLELQAAAHAALLGVRAVLNPNP